MPWLILGALALLVVVAKRGTHGASTFANGMPMDAGIPPELVTLINQRLSEQPYTYDGFIALSQLLTGTAAGLGPVWPLASDAVWARLRELIAQHPEWSAPRPA
jgi:hypothetical protein